MAILVGHTELCDIVINGPVNRRPIDPERLCEEALRRCLAQPGGGGIFVTCWEVYMPTYEERKALRNAADRKAIVAAGLAGFMDCSDVFDALGFDRVNASGTPRSVMQVAYRWIADAGFEVEYIIPDGITDVPKSQRTGCYADDLPAIVAYKDAYYAELRQREWDTAMLSATDAREKDGDGGNTELDYAYMESLGVRPEVDLGSNDGCYRTPVCN